MAPTVEEFLARVVVPKQAPCRRKSILLKGKPGTGKTHQILFVEGPVLCLSQDPNRMTLEMSGTKRDDITELFFDKWSDFDPDFLNKLKNREFNYETIFVDPIDMLYNLYIDKERGHRTKLDYDNWTNVLNTQRRCTFELVQACRPRKGFKDYNVVVTVHTKRSSDADQRTTAIECHIQGQFRDIIEGYFDLVLIADEETKNVTVPGTTTKERRQTHFIRTVPNDNYSTTKTPENWPARVNTLADIQNLIDADIPKTKNQ